MEQGTPIHVIGSGGHARVVVRAVQDLGYRVAAVFDDDPARWGTELLGVEVIGPIAAMGEHAPLPAVIAIGDNAARRRIAAALERRWLTIVHPAAHVDRDAALGPGTVVLAGAVVATGATIGEHAIINTSAVVDHDCVVGDYAHLAPRACLTGGVRMGEGTLVGAGAVVNPGRRVGAWAIVGAGAAVVKDVEPEVVAVGVPARVKRLAHPADRAHQPTDGARGNGKAVVRRRIYLSPPHMSPAERGLLIEAFDSNWIAPLGPHVDAFEEEFRQLVGAEHAVALSSGTAALHLALLLSGVGAGDEVAVSTLTFAATANAVRYVGASPVFIDSERRTWNLDPDLLEAEIRDSRRRGRPLKAVVAVDAFGQCADYGAIEEICRAGEVVLIEDAAEALGATHRGRAAGRFGQFGCFSFNGNKILTTSGGGMLVTDRADLAQRARHLATQARDPAPHYEHSEVGYNYRMSNLLAAVGRGQLRVLAERVAQRRANFAYYRETLRDLPGWKFMPEDPQGRATRWLTCATIDPREFGATREEVRLALEREDIESRPLWKPMHMQPAYAGCRARGGRVSEALFRDGLCLPSGSSLTREDLERVVAVIRDCQPQRRTDERAEAAQRPAPGRGVPPQTSRDHG